MVSYVKIILKRDTGPKSVTPFLFHFYTHASTFSNKFMYLEKKLSPVTEIFLFRFRILCLHEIH